MKTLRIVVATIFAIILSFILFTKPKWGVADSTVYSQTITLSSGSGAGATQVMGPIPGAVMCAWQATGTLATLTYAVYPSQDGTTLPGSGYTFFSDLANPASATSASANSNTVYWVPNRAQYLVFKVSAYTSGTATIQASCFTSAAPQVLAGTTSVSFPTSLPVSPLASMTPFSMQCASTATSGNYPCPSPAPSVAANQGNPAPDASSWPVHVVAGSSPLPVTTPPPTTTVNANVSGSGTLSFANTTNNVATALTSQSLIGWQLTGPGSCTGGCGIAIFEVSYDGGTVWYPAPLVYNQSSGNLTTTATYTDVAATSASFLEFTGGATNARVRSSTAGGAANSATVTYNLHTGGMLFIGAQIVSPTGIHGGVQIEGISNGTDLPVKTAAGIVLSVTTPAPQASIGVVPQPSMTPFSVQCASTATSGNYVCPTPSPTVAPVPIPSMTPFSVQCSAVATSGNYPCPTPAPQITDSGGHAVMASPAPATAFTPLAVSTGSAYGVLSTSAVSAVVLLATWGSPSTSGTCYVTLYDNTTPTVGTNPLLGPFAITTSSPGNFAIPIPPTLALKFTNGIAIGIATTMTGATACNTSSNQLFISGLHL